MRGRKSLPLLIKVYTIGNIMVKSYFRNTALYSLALLNLVTLIKSGFTLFGTITLSLTAIVLVWDIVDFIKRRF